MAEKEIFYEMLWDCAQCETRGLLGSSHRHCPTCGAAQDAVKRYFPKPGEEVEAKNHKYVGTDWNCAYCGTPNSLASAHCTNCGAGQDGSQPVAIVADTQALPVVAAAAPPAKPQWGWMRWALGLTLLAVMALVAMFFITKNTAVSVSQKTWQREIQIERFAPVSESAWCDAVPADAYSVTQSREQRSTKKIPDGQDCQETRVDKGDGTFVKRQECTPRYREEPVYDSRCHFQINRWRVHRAVKSGSETSLAPVWPSLGQLTHGKLGTNGALGSMGTIGAEREGARREVYELTLTSGGKSWSCKVSESIWTKTQQGSTTQVKVRMIGGPDCSTIQ